MSVTTPRVEQADVADRLVVVLQLLGREVLVVVERSGADLGQAHGRARRLDVALDVGRLPGGLGRLDPEALDERGVDAPRHDGDEAPQAHREDRQDPAPAPDVDDEQGHGQDRDHQEQVGGRQLGLDIGEQGAVHRAPGGQRELVALQPVVGHLDQGQEGQQDREVGLDLGRHPGPGVLHPDAAVEVVGHGGDQQDDDQRGEQPGDHERQEGQLEDVEADVGVELRVLHTEVDAVDEQQPLVPLAGDTGPGDDGEQEGHARPDPARARVSTISW